MNQGGKICRKFRVSLDLGSDGASPYQRILGAIIMDSAPTDY
jgi:hypothetical protein